MHPQKSSPAHAPHARAHAPHVRHVELDDGAAFVSDYRHGFVAVADGDAEAAGEEFIAAATSAEAVAESARDEVLADELEGLHIETLDETDE
jgi:hypothetical protein